VVRSDTGGDAELELGCLVLDQVGRQVSWMERRSNQYFGISEFLLEDAVGAFLVAGDLDTRVSHEIA
jgi:hypothetical protein